MKKWILYGIALLVSGFTVFTYASVTIPMQATANGKSIGTVQADDTIYGLLLTPKLHGLPAGIHGFHIHEMPMCQYHGMTAGGHLDPNKTQQHLGPYRGGHLGDLPVLIVNAAGKATLPVLAPRLKLVDIKGHSLMVHAGGDNYADKPEKLGGGGAREACGIVPDH